VICLVRWRGIIRSIIPALLLFSPIIIAISYLGYSYLRGYVVSIDLLLGVVILFQTYIIWIQVEISLRQSEVSKTEYEPSFKIKNRYLDTLTGVPLIVSIENVGEYPAYNVMFGLMNKTTRKPIEKTMRLVAEPRTLAPKDSIDILHIDPVELNNTEIEMNVIYNNVANEMRQTTFVKFPRSTEFMLVFAPLNARQGILLKSLEDFKLAYQAMKWRNYPKKSEQIKSNKS